MSSEFRARDPEFQERVRASFAQQGLMSTFAARLDRVDPGLVEIVVPFAHRLTQQDGFLHAGVVIAAMDSACGYAALSLMDPDFRVLTVELKVNLLSVASGAAACARAGPAARAHAHRVPWGRVCRDRRGGTPRSDDPHHYVRGRQCVAFVEHRAIWQERVTRPGCARARRSR